MDIYLLTNIFFVSLVLLVFRITTFNRPQAITLIVILCLTAVFDSLIVGLHIVAYDSTKILGFYVGNAPIEDFFYALLAVCIVPTIWHILERHDAKH
jgi:lycopene cyclase domain-containing protein